MFHVGSFVDKKASVSRDRGELEESLKVGLRGEAGKTKKGER